MDTNREWVAEASGFGWLRNGIVGPAGDLYITFFSPEIDNRGRGHSPLNSLPLTGQPRAPALADMTFSPII